MVTVYWIFRRFSASRVDNIFRRGQLLSAAAFSLGPDGNDAQKTMGIMTAVLTAGGVWGMQYGPNGTLPTIPIEVVLAAHAAIALGTLSGGWRIVRTMGTRFTKLKPVGGFCAETAAALTLAYVTLTGTPVSTTHTITRSIVGVGATRRLPAVKWASPAASSGPGFSPSPPRPWSPRVLLDRLHAAQTFQLAKGK